MKGPFNGVLPQAMKGFRVFTHNWPDPENAEMKSKSGHELSMKTGESEKAVSLSKGGAGVGTVSSYAPPEEELPDDEWSVDTIFRGRKGVDGDRSCCLWRFPEGLLVHCDESNRGQG